MTDLTFQDPKGLVNRAAFNERFSVLNELYRYWWKRIKAQKVSVSTEISDWEYVFSDSRNAYPDFGEKDGYEYQYLGVPFENAREGTKISIGSYIGTGKYGKSNPNRIVTGFKVRMLMIFIERDSGESLSPYNTKFLSPVSSYNDDIRWFISPPGSTAYFVSNCRRLNPQKILLIKMDFNDDNVSWYVVSDGISAGNVQFGDSGQHNSSGTTYHYLALG